jgi:hypothetical protein
MLRQAEVELVQNIALLFFKHDNLETRRAGQMHDLPSAGDDLH